jgi:hypothetical protein
MIVVNLWVIRTPLARGMAPGDRSTQVSGEAPGETAPLLGAVEPYGLPAGFVARVFEKR